MAIQLDTSKLGKQKAAPIKTISGNAIHKMSRIIQDLEHKYTEVNAKADAHGQEMEYIDLYGFPIDTAHLGVLTQKQVEYYQMGVFSMKEKNLFLATPKPGYELHKELLALLEKKGFTYKIFYCSPMSLSKLIKAYGHVVSQKVFSDEINIDEDKMKSYTGDYLEFQKNATKYSMSEMIERVLKLAIDTKASDIHLEPEKEYYHIRLRLDGVLQDLANLPKVNQRFIESRIKIMSKLKLNVDNATQDGRFSFIIDSKSIDVRVSMLPSNYGYSIVMRLLGTDNVVLEMSQLGFVGTSKERVLTALSKPQGLILTTGPTGSGKTTTLYTFLKTLNDGENKIITLEDPIEYKIEGLSQTQINVESGYTFGSGLRSILRQDPDIVMVGEIRDLETAETAVQASFTGHQVLSTIHTNDATGSIPRLLQMGLEGYLIADSLQIAIGQRLVRKLCEFCKQKTALTMGEQKIVIEELTRLPASEKENIPKKLEFFKPIGCPKCSGLGYKGRVGCYEVLEMDDAIRTLLTKSEMSLVEIRNTARANGMLSMFQDGLLKALRGMVDIQELQRNMSR
jgi:type II secretory ATPase GspE/PulE/Tfp pilus assembly ATPase PilB-like protein